MNNHEIDGELADRRLNSVLEIAAKGGQHIASQQVFRDPALELAAAKQTYPEATSVSTSFSLLTRY